LVARCPTIGKRGGVFYEGKIKNKKLDLVVIRVNKSGETCNARPCHNCLSMMKDVGIRKVYYSTSPDELVCENVKDMISIHSSSVSKHFEKINGNHLVDDIDMYYKNILIKNFPPVIRKHNLESFIKHNLSNIFPSFEVQINNSKLIICILDDDKKPIIQAKLIP
jgi:hypothetical protein